MDILEKKGQNRQRGNTFEIMKEKNIEPRLVAKVAELTGQAIKITSPAFSGLPDRMILLPGGVICFAETKSTGDTPRPRQLFVHGMLRRLGFVVFVVDSEERLQECLAWCKSKIKNNA